MFYVFPSILFFYRSQFTSHRNKKRQTENEGTIKTRRVKFWIIFLLEIILLLYVDYSFPRTYDNVVFELYIDRSIVNYNDLFKMNGFCRC